MQLSCGMVDRTIHSVKQYARILKIHSDQYVGFPGMSPSKHEQSKGVEERIEFALRTLSDIRNHALDVLRCDDARWIVRRERQDLLNYQNCNNQLLNDWRGLVQLEREMLVREFDWIRTRIDLDFELLARKLQESFSKHHPHRPDPSAGMPTKGFSGIPQDLQQALHKIPSKVARQYVIPSYQEISDLDPVSINPKILCDYILQYQAKRELPFSIDRIFRGKVKAFVLERSESMIGTILWDATNFGDGNSMEILGLWVSPLERRDGIASALLKRAAKVALRAGKSTLLVRYDHRHVEMREVLHANGFFPASSRKNIHTDTKVAAAYSATINDIFHSDECSARIKNQFSEMCGGIDIAAALCRARRSLLRLTCPRPSQSRVFKYVISALHHEDQLSGKEREITAKRNTSQLRFNAKLQSLQAQSREIKQHIPSLFTKVNSQGRALQYFSHTLSDLSSETRPDDFCAAVAQLGTVQWKFIPSLSSSSFGHTVSVLDEELASQVLDLHIEPQHSALVSDAKDLHALLRSEEVIALATAKERTLTGLSIGSLIEESLVFHQLVVDERFRRIGYGRSLVNAMIAHAVFVRAQSVAVSVFEHNAAAIKLFASCGFVAKLIPSDTTCAHDMYRFELKLTNKI